MYIPGCHPSCYFIGNSPIHVGYINLLGGALRDLDHNSILWCVQMSCCQVGSLTQIANTSVDFHCMILRANWLELLIIEVTAIHNDLVVHIITRNEKPESTLCCSNANARLLSVPVSRSPVADLVESAWRRGSRYGTSRTCTLEPVPHVSRYPLIS